MATLGRVALLVALAVAVWGTVAASWGQRGGPAYSDSARTSLLAVAAAVLVANGAMLAALLGDDFTVRYVAQNSSRATPVLYKALALWAGDEGSLLLWNLVLSGYGCVLALRLRTTPRTPLADRIVACFLAVVAFYLYLMVLPADPFAIAGPAPDGGGVQPLLRSNVLMAVHPPLLYLGLLGFAVPFAYVLATLMGRTDADWCVRAIRPWVMAAWCFLTAGVCTGALWSYQVLGWGGYWAWDPVENAALMPWLTATAYLHSSHLQKRRRVLRVWNLSLIIGTFALTVFGTFITRGNLLNSVHSFTESSLGPSYLVFLVLVVLVGAVLLSRRAPELYVEGRLNGVLSRTAALLAANLVFGLLTAFILIGTVYPLVAAAVAGTQVSIGAPFFREFTTPLFVAMLALAGVGPVLPWRALPPGRFFGRIALATAVAAGTAVTLRAAGVDRPDALFGIAGATFVIVGHAEALLRSVRTRRRCGALVAHVGVAVVALGIVVSSGFSQRADVTLRPGQQASLADYQFSYLDLSERRETDRTVVATHLLVTRGGSDPTLLVPSINLFSGVADAIGSPAISHRGLGDVYASLTAVGQQDRQATLSIYLNEGMALIWGGAFLIVCGGALTALPRWRRNRRPAPRPDPVGVGP